MPHHSYVYAYVWVASHKRGLPRIGIGHLGVAGSGLCCTCKESAEVPNDGINTEYSAAARNLLVATIPRGGFEAGRRKSCWVAWVCTNLKGFARTGQGRGFHFGFPWR